MDKKLISTGGHKVDGGKDSSHASANHVKDSRKDNESNGSLVRKSSIGLKPAEPTSANDKFQGQTTNICERVSKESLVINGQSLSMNESSAAGKVDGAMRNVKERESKGSLVTKGRSATLPISESSYSDGQVEGRMRSRQGSSCQALRHAVLKLYRIDDFDMNKIGEGYFSEVYKVVHKVNNDIMVLKMNVNESNKTNMLREAQLMNRMHHPNVLKFLGVCVHKGQLHALTEYINGGDLHTILTSDEALPWRIRVSLSKDIALGVQYLHQTGYLHRDLTSRNVLVRILDDRKMTGVVSDFGLVAKIPDSSNPEFHLSVAGSPYWMSPECITGNRYYEKADVFSFGILQCEIIARVDANPEELPRTGNFGLDYVAFSEMVGECPLHYLHLAFKCCQIDPDRRPSLLEAASSLDNILAHRLIDEVYDLPLITPALVPPTIQISTAQDGAGAHTPAVQRLKFDFPDHALRRCKSTGEYDWALNISEALGQDPATYPAPVASPSTAQVMGLQMSRVDPFYSPGQVAENPFTKNGRFRDGRKQLASSTETAHYYSHHRQWNHRASVGSPRSPHFFMDRADGNTMLSPRQTCSLPDNDELVDQAIGQLRVRIGSQSPKLNNSSTSSATGQQSPSYIVFGSSLDEPFDDAASVDSAVVLESGRRVTLGATLPYIDAEAQRRRRSFSARQHKQLSLECAMLFCGIELIHNQRKAVDDLSEMERNTRARSIAEAAAWARNCNEQSSDLEVQFQDDLEDVLRSCSSSETYLSMDDLAALSPGGYSTFTSNTDDITDAESGIAVEPISCTPAGASSDPNGTQGGKFNKTLVEMRRSLRRVEPRNKEKMEELQQKLDELKKIDQRIGVERKRSNRIMSMS